MYTPFSIKIDTHSELPETETGVFEPLDSEIIDGDSKPTLGLLHLLHGDTSFDLSEIDPKVEFADVNEFEIV